MRALVIIWSCENGNFLRKYFLWSILFLISKYVLGYIRLFSCCSFHFAPLPCVCKFSWEVFLSDHLNSRLLHSVASFCLRCHIDYFGCKIKSPCSQKFPTFCPDFPSPPHFKPGYCSYMVPWDHQFLIMTLIGIWLLPKLLPKLAKFTVKYFLTQSRENTYYNIG